MDFNIDSFMLILLNLPKPRLRVREATINCLIVALTSCILAWTFGLIYPRKKGGCYISREGVEGPGVGGRGVKWQTVPARCSPVVSVGA